MKTNKSEEWQMFAEGSRDADTSMHLMITMKIFPSDPHTHTQRHDKLVTSK